MTDSLHIRYNIRYNNVCIVEKITTTVVFIEDIHLVNFFQIYSFYFAVL